MQGCVGHVGVGWGESCRAGWVHVGVGCVIRVGGSCRGGVGHVGVGVLGGVGWVM